MKRLILKSDVTTRQDPGVFDLKTGIASGDFVVFSDGFLISDVILLSII